MDSPSATISAGLHNRRFSLVSNAHGLSTADTVFHYLVDGEAINRTYQGGSIRLGQQIGRITGPETFELLYHCVTHDGQLLAGWSRGTLGVDPAGRSTLSFVWGWLCGATGGGVSHYLEIVA